MVKVTDLNYSLEKRLIKKLDIIIKRVEREHPKKDACLSIEGLEGEGKTNTSCAIAYYMKHQTGREIYLSFRLEPLIEFAKKNEKKIIIWDEPALDSLSTDWYKKTNKDLIRLLMVVRKKRHVFIFNFTKFYKFSEYIIVDRAIGLIHMYSRHQIESGRFMYIRKRGLETLYNAYRRSKKRLYAKLCCVRGTFPEVLEKKFTQMGINILTEKGIINNATYQDYEKLKDEAIESVGVEDEKVNLKEIQLKMLKYKVSQLSKVLGIEAAKIAEPLDIKPQTLSMWQERYKLVKKP